MVFFLASCTKKSICGVLYLRYKDSSGSKYLFLLSCLYTAGSTLQFHWLDEGAGSHPPFSLITHPIQLLSVQVSCSVGSVSLWPHGLQHARLPCPSPTSWACLSSCPSSRWCHPTISSTVVPLSSCLQSFPASRSFQMSQFFASGGQSIGVSASASVLPMNIQDWFPLGLSGLISLQSKGLSRVFSNTTVQKHQFFSAQLSLSSFLKERKWKKVKSLSRVRLFVTPWSIAQQAPPSMGFSRQEYWSGLPFPSPYPASWETIKMKCFRYRHTHLIHKPHIPFFCWK